MRGEIRLSESVGFLQLTNEVHTKGLESLQPALAFLAESLFIKTKFCIKGSPLESVRLAGTCIHAV